MTLFIEKNGQVKRVKIVNQGRVIKHIKYVRSIVFYIRNSFKLTKLVMVPIFSKKKHADKILGQFLIQYLQYSLN